MVQSSGFEVGFPNFEEHAKVHKMGVLSDRILGYNKADLSSVGRLT